MNLSTLLSELRCRRVFRVAGVYSVAAFAALQGAQLLIEALHLPGWLLTALAVLALVALPVVLALAWAFDITPEGVRRTEGGAPDGHAPASGRSTRKIAAAVLSVLVLGLAGFAVYARLGPPAPGAAEDQRPGSIAVLPFVNISGDPEQEYFSDGISEEILNALADVPGLRVAARASSFTFRGANVPVDEIGRRLGVAHVLDGSARRSGDRVRIVARLTDARSQTQLWSETYDEELKDVFAVQERIGQAIAAALRVRVAGTGGATVGRRGTSNLEAYDFYLRGLHQYRRLNEPAMERAIDYFERAVRLDPEFADAWVALAFTYTELADAYRAPHDMSPKASAALRRALELDPDHAQARTLFGTRLFAYHWDFAGGERELRRAMELAPDDPIPLHYWNTYLIAMGRLDEAGEAAEQAFRLDPLSAHRSLNVEVTRYLSRQYDRAIAQHAVTLELDPSFRLGAGCCLAQALIALGRFEEAIAAAGPTDAEIPDPMLAIAYVQAGRRPEAEAVLRRLEAVARRRYIAPEHIAAVHLHLGDRERALEWLEKGVEARSFFALWQADPIFDPIRADPRFAALRRRTGAPPLPALGGVP